MPKTRSLWVMLVLAVVAQLGAADLTLTDGRTYKNWTFLRQTPYTISLRCDKGIATVSKRLLPPELAVQYPIDEAAAEQERQQAEESRQREAAERERLRPQREAQVRAEAAAARQFEEKSARDAEKALVERERIMVRAQRYAENWFRSEYRPGGNSSTYVLRASARIISAEPAAGWPGRWTVKGRANVGYYISSGSSLSNEAHDFEMTLDRNGQCTLDLRS